MLFADNTKGFKHVKNVADCVCLQNDSNAVCNWSRQWKLYFNTSKCKVLAVTRQHKYPIYDYSMEGIVLDRVNEMRDLGVTVDC